jgi:DNA replicative helicase MCM subunit Mcm2 (Cdc46/Mcm family)|tara:strand:+ start:5662 stop:6492 length:831 start_codon:yes stop_codon:yes gene_type:complete
MSDERVFPGPTPAQADTLNAWRELFESKHSQDFKSLEGTDCLEQPIFPFEVDYRDIDRDDVLNLYFNEIPEATIELANEVLRTMVAENEVSDIRCILRPMSLPPERTMSISSLRMRDRGKIVSSVVRIKDVGPRLGYLQEALYVCVRCDSRETIKQKIARERKRPGGPCKECFDKAMETFEGKIPYSVYEGLKSSMKLTAEGSFYKDIQYLSVSDIDDSSGQPIWVVIDDEYVDAYNIGDTVRINGIVQIDPVPDRNFMKDTRRILQIHAFSIENL